MTGLLMVGSLAAAELPPIAFESAKLVTSAPSHLDSFANEGLAIDLDTLAVGAPTASGCDGCSSGGKVYVFERKGDTWVETMVLFGSAVESGDRFGTSLAISGDLIFVGAPEPSSGHLGEDDGGDLSAGEVYVFENGVEIAILEASDASSGDQFGRTLALSAQTLFVGAEAASHTNSPLDTGAVYVFDQGVGGASDYQEMQKFSIPVENPTKAFEFFSTQIAASGDTLLVTSTGNNVPQSVGNVLWVFERGPEGLWEFETTLAPSVLDGGARFGETLAIDEDTAIVGAFLGDSDIPNTGVAFVFERDEDGEWHETAKLEESFAGVAFYGLGVAVEGDIAVVGAGSSGNGRGSAFVYRRDGGGPGNWGGVATLQASDGEQQHWLGYLQVGLSGRTIALPAQGDDEACLPGGFDCGAVYLFGDL